MITATTTVIHEATHELRPDIVDHAYSGSSGFNTFAVKQKLANADHYAEAAKKNLGLSAYTTALRPVSREGVRKPVSPTAKSSDAGQEVRRATTGLERMFKATMTVHRRLRNHASHTEMLTPPDLDGYKEMLGLPRRGADATRVSELDLALSEGVASVLNRARSQLAPLQKDGELHVRLMKLRDGAQQPLAAPSIAYEAVRHVGGFSRKEVGDKEMFERIARRTGGLILQRAFPEYNV
jgi:hypothetical protein